MVKESQVNLVLSSFFNNCLQCSQPIAEVKYFTCPSVDFEPIVFVYFLLPPLVSTHETKPGAQDVLQ